MEVSRGRRWRWFALVPGVMAACSGDSDDSVETGESWAVAAQPTVTIGQVDGEPEYLFSRITDAVLLPGGGVAVADGDAASIRLFSADGTFDRELGRRGDGPGEFQGISELEVVPPDTLVVHDSRSLRLSRFLTSGSLVSTLSLEAEDGFPEVYLGRYTSGQYAFAWIRLGPRDGSTPTPDIMRVARFSEEGRMEALLGEETGMIRSGSSPLAFSPHLFAELIGDSVFLTDGLPPEIQVWDGDGGLARTIAVPAPEVDPSSAWAELGAVLAARGNEFEMGWFEDQAPPEVVPPISMMVVDDRERLWFKKYVPATDSHLLMTGRGRGGDWLVVDRGGELVATVELPDGFLLLDVRGDTLVGKTLDDLGVERIAVYEIGRRGE